MRVSSQGALTACGDDTYEGTDCDSGTTDTDTDTDTVVIPIAALNTEKTPETLEHLVEHRRDVRVPYTSVFGVKDQTCSL